MFRRGQDAVLSPAPRVPSENELFVAADGNATMNVCVRQSRKRLGGVYFLTI
jgi:hypothetical protein